MKKVLLAAFLLCLGLQLHAQEFLVFKVKSKIKGYGPAFATQPGITDRGQTKDKWKGVLLYDLASGQGAIVWRTKVDGNKVQETLSFGFSLFRYVIDDKNGQKADIYGLHTAADFGSHPDDETIRTLFLRGRGANREDVGVGLTPRVSNKLKGMLWLIEEEEESFRSGDVKARLRDKDSRFANDSLGDYNNDGNVTLDDLVENYQDEYQVDGYLQQ